MPLTRSRPPHPARHRSRGAATVEAVVALPFFILVFVSIVYMRDQYVAQQTANAEARTCAWLYSANACDGTPPGCGHVDRADTSTAIDQTLNNALGKLGEGALDSAKNLDVSGFQGVVSDVLRGMLTEIIAELFRKVGYAEGRAQFTRPGLYGGGEFWMRGRAEVPCNLKPTTPLKVLEDVFDKIFP